MASQTWRWSPFAPLVIALALALGTPGPASAFPSPTAPDPAYSRVEVAPLWANAISWHGFVTFWSHFANRADRIVLIVLAVMAAALFIITRGKWL